MEQGDKPGGETQWNPRMDKRILSCALKGAREEVDKEAAGHWGVQYRLSVPPSPRIVMQESEPILPILLILSQDPFDFSLLLRRDDCGSFVKFLTGHHCKINARH